MAELKHGAHECVLTAPEIKADGICNMCYKDEPVAFACELCNFDLCGTCSKLPLKVSHDFHRHPLEFCVGMKEGNASYKLCSGCGDLFSGSSFYYKCKNCEIYLDVGCAVLNIDTSWYAEEKLHYSHAHLLRRCKPGTAAKGSCLLCELPLTPSSICYGCFHCYSFVHERCLDLPRVFHHPVDPNQPLIRLDFSQNCGPQKHCVACGLEINGVPLGCLDWSFGLHLRCADSMLRGLVHKHHPHKLFYVPNNPDEERTCRLCTKEINRGDFRDPYFHCIECYWVFHLECLGIPKTLVKKRYHIHPLVCQKFSLEEDSLEYCGVCETMVHAGHDAYCCQECDFVGHIGCILREGEAPSPLYLKDVYSHNENVTSFIDQDESEDEELENKPVVNGIEHKHVMVIGNVYIDNRDCQLCEDNRIYGKFWKCKKCDFRAHDICLKILQKTRYGFHTDHPLTLLPGNPSRITINCHACKDEINFYNLFCRICNFVICTKCTVKASNLLQVLQRGQKFIRYEEMECLKKEHTLVQVIVSRSYPVACTICNNKLCGNVVTCMECEEVYHPRCIQLRGAELCGHPLHPHHTLSFWMVESGSKCIVCKLDVTKYGFTCSDCSINFHTKCIEAVGISTTIKSHQHYLYSFCMDASSSSRRCTICNKLCGLSFYCCYNCNFRAHVECTGFPSYVKNQQHPHAVQLKKRVWYSEKRCSLCGLEIESNIYEELDYYSCGHCEDMFHMECIMSKEVEREATTEEEQIIEIYLMYIEHDLVRLVEDLFAEIVDIRNNSDEDWLSS